MNVIPNEVNNFVLFFRALCEIFYFVQNEKEMDKTTNKV